MGLVSIFIIIYLLITLGIGVYASRRIKNDADFLLAGRKLPLYLDTATVFATWFGSECLLGAPARMAEEGLMGVMEDPFGAALCLVLVGLFFARPLYRMKLLTFGDFYRERFGKKVEKMAGFILVISYFGWIAAQFLALGFILNLVFGISIAWGVFLGSVLVISYTFLGGMWGLAYTDLLQTIVIILGLVLVLFELNSEVPVKTVLQNSPDELFKMIPTGNGVAWINWFGMLITIGLGSIAGQDVFQRVMSAKSEKVAVMSSLLAGVLYLAVAMIPLYFGLFARYRYPELVQSTSEMMIPRLIMQHAGPVVNLFFFGALLSAVMSTASGALLAPSAILSENLLRPVLKKGLGTGLLDLTRLSVLLVSIPSVLVAMSGQSIFELVSLSSQITLVTLFVPLVFSLFFKVGNAESAMASMACGAIVWILSTVLDTEVLPLVWGFAASFLGYLCMAFFSNLFSKREPYGKC